MTLPTHATILMVAGSFILGFFLGAGFVRLGFAVGFKRGYFTLTQKGRNFSEKKEGDE